MGFALRRLTCNCGRELLGQRQSGVPRFRFGDLVRDLDLIRQARDLTPRL
jgi:RecG-like helicase